MVQRALSLTHSPSGSFLIRPSPVSRRNVALAGTDIRDAESDDIEKAFLEIDLLTEDKLKKLAKTENLEEVKKLEFRVDTTTQSISQLGMILPGLRELVLDESVVNTFREFGTSLRNLQVLHLTSSHVNDLDGISALDALEELYVDCNYIKSLTPLAMHESLETLSLKGNLVADFTEVDQLGTCFKLESLTLQQNAVAQVSCYRRIIAQLLPQIKSLDGSRISSQDRVTVSDDEMDEAAMFLASLDEQTIHQFASGNGQDELSASKMESALVRPTTPKKLQSSSSIAKFTTEDEQSSLSKSQQEQSASSDLTHGANVVFAGNLAASMRRRKKATQSDTKSKLRETSNSLERQQDDSEGFESSFSRRSPEDDLMDQKLEELLALSSGLEMEFKKLQVKDTESEESPKSKLLRRKKRSSDSNESSTSSSSKASSSSNRTGNPYRRSRASSNNQGESSPIPLDEEEPQDYRKKRERDREGRSKLSKSVPIEVASSPSSSHSELERSPSKPEIDRCSSRESERSQPTDPIPDEKLVSNKVRASSGLKNTWKPSPRVRRQTFTESKISTPIRLPKPSEDMSELAEFMAGLSDEDLEDLDLEEKV